MRLKNEMVFGLKSPLKKKLYSTQNYKNRYKRYKKNNT